jgi:ADP-ribose pyrophosphatase YjhB (NUDIX family)
MSQPPAPKPPRRNPTGQSVGPSEWRVPPGDERERLVCTACGYIHYDNPKIVVGVVATWQDKVLMCRRGIPPRHGYWTLPAGYMEVHETTAAGAAREAYEEARAHVEIGPLLAVYEVPRISQVHLFYCGRLKTPEIEPGPESLEARLFAWADIPFAEIAFPTTRWALDHFREVQGEAAFAVRTNPPGEFGDMKP